ncbi:polysaccharide lyase family 7 protein [Colwellia sp. E2M01]|uniref:polysaccharide lyase family 7 protein n=1 Tax=Colwellia sp. E2M01 TaxID=2841561 RepID=UPI001C09D610|nr:polysaccharide lyase family 7 protein [Colwellia sp. E2M01]MBU2869073.1 polysaccharide lyase family 7 protein [Colwellia sp. E2M01]
MIIKNLVAFSLVAFLAACSEDSIKESIDDLEDNDTVIVDDSNTNTDENGNTNNSGDNDTDSGNDGSNTDTGGADDGDTDTDDSSATQCINEKYTITSATDDGTHNTNEGPDKAIDGNTANESRWSSAGIGKAITFDLGETKEVNALQIKWLKGDSRTSVFDIHTSIDNEAWSTALSAQESSGADTGFEVVNLHESINAQYVKIIGLGNSEGGANWNSIIETEVYKCALDAPVDADKPEDVTDDTSPGDAFPTPTGTPSAVLTYDSLDSTKAPSENFDLSYWYLSVPTDTNDDGKSDSIYEKALNDAYEDENKEFFYTAADGGMVFNCPIAGYKTSTNTTYTRVELREMIRAGNTSISTQGVNKNNWVFSSAPISAQDQAGGVDGTMKATLAINHVTEIIEDYVEDGKNKTSEYRVGRVVIGQIHAKDDEPIRLYYQKLPGNSKGSIYFAHEPAYDAADEIWIEMIGTRGSGASNPVDGIALDEKFSYEINVTGNILSVSILRNGKETITKTISMNGSLFDVADDYMYFKAGIYMADKLAYDEETYSASSNRPNESAQATFYALEVTHN